MAHLRVDSADAILDREYSVLDKGFVRLVDYLGGDARIVQAARVSYGEGTKTVREDAALIDYLLRHKHTSPFEQVILTFHLKMPIFVARQWIRHRTARLNEISGRYSVMKDEFYAPEPERVQKQSQANKQGSADEVPRGLQSQVVRTLQNDQSTAYSHYQDLLDDEVSRELARINLPLSLYTEMYWQIDLSNLFHFLRLRMDSHAQYEIRVYGEVMAQMVKAVAPLAYEAFEEHILYGRSFSKTELNLLHEALDMKRLENALSESGMRKSRQREFSEKLNVEKEQESEKEPTPTS